MRCQTNETQTLENQADKAASAGNFDVARLLLEQAVEASGSSPGLWVKLSAMRKASGDFNGALAAIESALNIAEFDLLALLTRAVLLDNLGDPRAGEAYRHALAQIRPNEAVPAEWKAAVAHARNRNDDYRKTLEQYLAKDLPSGLSPAEASRARRFITNRSRTTGHYHQEPCDFHFPGMPEIEFYDREMFPGISALEQMTEVIRSEFDALIAAEVADMVPYVQYPESVPLRQWKELINNPNWTAIHLLMNGWRVEANARHCPQTMDAISKMDQPRVPGTSPVAMFSLLAPRTRTSAHKGVTNTRLVCHLPLIVPPHCGFRVGATDHEWRVGEAFVFDDTIEHEAWNNSDDLRVVLIFDVWPPGLGPVDRRIVAAVIGASNANFVATNRLS